MFVDELSGGTPEVLVYDRPAGRWLEALPLGNGFTGAMVYGGVAHEVVALNDSTAWSGGPASQQRPPVVSADQARAALRESRAALAQGGHARSDEALRRLQHRHSQSYLPLAELQLDFARADGVPWAEGRYRRWLDLTSAVAGIRHEQDGVVVRREIFASHPGHVVVYRIQADVPLNLQLHIASQLRVLGTLIDCDDEGEDDEGGRASDALALRGPSSTHHDGQRSALKNSDGLAALLRGPSDIAPPHERTDHPVEWDDDPQTSIRAAVVCRLSHDGQASRSDSTLAIRGATRCDIVVATASNVTRIGGPLEGDEHTACRKAAQWCEEALAVGIDAVRAAHIDDYSPLFGRVRWELADARPSGLTTDRIIATSAGDPRGPLVKEPGLAPMLFNMGRYLLLSSARDSGMPANLQGIWNNDLRPAWSSNYTININTQMNYWAADVTDLPETVAPLVQLIRALSVQGQETATRLYGAHGWVAHHNTDIWGYTQPVGNGVDNPKWAYFPLAGVWLARHLTSHLEFGARSADDIDEFAATVVWPVISSATEFVLDMVVDVDGTLGTCPSTSPENDFWTPDREVGESARSSTIDVTLIRELLSDFLALAGRLGRQNELTGRASAALSRLGRPRINERGRVVEWWDDLVSTDPHHRHQSHLYGVFPGRQRDPDFLAAASASLDDRGDDSTGWSLVWRIALRARLGEPDGVERLLSLLFRNADDAAEGFHGGLYPNLFAAHPPFQIDANLGYPAAVAECLLCDCDTGDSIAILPALPPSLASARVSGLVARPGVRVDVAWVAGADGRGRLAETRLAPITPAAQRAFDVRYRGRSVKVDLAAGPITLLAADFG